MKGILRLAGVMMVLVLGTHGFVAAQQGGTNTGNPIQAAWTPVPAPGSQVTLGIPVPLDQPVAENTFPGNHVPVRPVTVGKPRLIVRGQMPDSSPVGGFPPPPPPPPPPGQGFVDPLLGGVPPCAPPCPPLEAAPPPPSDCPLYRWFIYGDYLMLKARGGDVAYAQPRDGAIPGVDSSPMGPVASVDASYSSGFRIGGGYGFSDTNFLEGSFMWYRSSNSSSTTAPTGTFLKSLLTFPATLSDVDPLGTQEASARYDIDLQVIDLDFKHIFLRCPAYQLSWFAGARYAHLEQDLQANFSILGTTTVQSNIDFTGIGPRVGLEGECHSQCGIFLYGKGSANFLVGRFTGNYQQNNTFAGLQAATSVSDNRVVHNLDMEVGVGWQSKNGRFRALLGYYLSYWSNTLTMPNLIDRVQNTNFNGDNFRDKFIFDGLMARLEFRF